MRKLTELWSAVFPLTVLLRQPYGSHMLRKFVACAFILATLSARAADGVKITEGAEKVRVEINGKLFTEYHFKGAPHVYFYPLIGPGEVHMTRHYPMKRDYEGEEHDHHHHRSLWYSHGD